MAEPPLPPLFALAAACCARDFDAPRLARIRALADGADWPALVRLARRHRVEALVRRGLGAAAIVLPEPAAATLSAAADRAITANLQAAGSMARLQRAFAAAGIDLLFLKGVTLGQLAYGNPLIKAAWDVDLLVAEADIAAAADQLGTEGFECVVPGPEGGTAAIVRWHRTAKESVWKNRAGQHLDLHDGLVDHPLLIPGVGMASARQSVVVGPGLMFDTLAGPDLYAYLCVHGGWSGWFRLKWAADLAALLASKTAEEIAALHDHAVAVGAGRASALALLLCERWLRTDLGPGLRERLQRDRRALALQRIVERAVLGPYLLEELASTWWMHRVQFGLAGGARYQWLQAGEEMRRFRRLAVKRLSPRGQD